MRKPVAYSLIFALGLGIGLFQTRNYLNSRGGGADNPSAVAWPALRPDDDVTTRWSLRNMVLPERPGEPSAGSVLPASFADLPERFDVAFAVTIQSADSLPARVLFNFQDLRNYYYAELDAAGTRIGRVESGVETILAEGTVGAVPGRRHELKVKRRELDILTFLDGIVAAVAYDDTFAHGSVGLASLDRSVKFRPIGRPQRIERALRFSDDFMRVGDESGAWQTLSGDWRNRAMRNPSMSANAFTYLGSGQHARAVTGQPFWDRYRVRVSMRGPKQGTMGLIFAYRDRPAGGAGEHYLFRWTARAEADGVAQIVRVRDGKETVVASRPGGYAPGVWYRVDLRTSVSECTVDVDGHRLLRIVDPALAEGRVGLYAHTPSLAVQTLEVAALVNEATGGNDKYDLRKRLDNQLWVEFDDVVVTDTGTYRERFDDAHAFARWQARGGQWQIADDADGRGRHVTADAGDGEEGRLLFGLSQWRNYAFGARLLGGRGAAGLVFNYLDEWNYHLFHVDLDAGRARLVKLDDGERRVLDETDLPDLRASTGEGGAGLRLGVRSRFGHLSASIDGRDILESWADRLRHGKVGLYTKGGERIRYDDAEVHFLDRHDPVISANAVFRREETMKAWAGANSEWYESRKRVGNTRVLWHRALFPGDIEFVADIQRERARDAQSELAIGIAKSGKADRNGYVMKVTVDRTPPDGEEDPSARAAGAAPYGTMKLSITREGKAVANVEAPAPENLHAVSVRRSGAYVSGYVNGVQQILFRDETPLGHAKVAYYARGLDVPPGNVRIYNRHVFNYTFVKAPTDWRIGSGYWEITNRWECDPRWSFFSGRSFLARNTALSRNRPAVLWNKRLFDGDVTVEFYAGPMMVGVLGRSYQYVRDINVTICGDGRDLDSGYTGSFGTNDNDYSGLFRGKTLLQRDDDKILRSSTIHRHWFYVRMERSGNTILYNVYHNGEPVVELMHEDKEPLTGKRVAIWTYGAGVMIGRVRISGPGGQTLEPPGTLPPAKTGNLYDE